VPSPRLPASTREDLFAPVALEDSSTAAEVLPCHPSALDLLRPVKQAKYSYPLICGFHKQ
jgi:hypothetical protein